MEPGIYEPVRVNTKSPRRRGGLLILASLLLGLLLLGGWLVTPTLAQIPVEFDLAISKSAVPSKFTVGTGNNYVITVIRTNSLTVGAPVIVEDQMPVGLTITEVTAEDWNCLISANDTQLVCTYAKSIPVDLFSLPPIFIGVDVPADIVPSVTNTATLATIDANLSNNVSTITTSIDSVDLAIKKSQVPQGILPTETITYTIVITNNGPATATNVIVDDELSTYLTYTSSTASQGSYNDSTGIWSVGNLTDDITATLNIYAIVKEEGLGKIIENVAEVSSSNSSDWNTANNTSKTSIIVGGLEIDKGIDKELPYTAFVGEPVTFLITVTNTSPNTISFINFTDIFTTSLDVDLDESNLLTQDFTLYRSSSNTGLIYGSFNLGGLKSTIVKIVARPNNTITTSTTITNTAEVKWSGLTVTSNEVSLVVEPAAAILVTKDDGVSTILPGEFLTYTINVKNIGSRIMGAGVEILDILPNFTIVNDIFRDTLPANAVITIDYPYIQTSLPQALNPDDEVSFRIKVLVVSETPIGTDLINTVRIETPAGYLNGNTETEDTDLTEVVTPISSGMSIDLSVSPAQAKTGDNFTFRIDVRNTGNVSASNVVVAGTMQSVLDYVSSTPATGTTFTANSTARTYSWSIGNLLPGQIRTLAMVWRVNTSVTASNSYNHFATMTWDTNKSLASNTVKYRVTTSSTLPGTGFGAATQQQSGGLILAATLLAGTLALLGAGALVYGIWARKKKPLWANWFMLAGVILLCGGALFGAAAWGFQSIPDQRPQELAAVSHVTQAPEVNPPALAQPTDFVEVWDAWPTPTPNSLPDYPIPDPPEHLMQGADGNEPDSSDMTRITIPAMGLDTVVKYVPFDSSSWLIGGLKQEVAWMGDTSWPGLGSNTGLAGHVDLANGDSGPFWNLGDLKAGDQVTVFTEHNQYTYMVRDSRIVPDSDLSVIEPTEKPQLTLITCAGWDAELKLYLLRLVVFADLVEVKPLNETALTQ
ncbi:MAG TPA: sortase [Anaerolineales bacterium]|nr:sortase [Anaerolineales bacterium]